jgi:hypothetical protein
MIALGVHSHLNSEKFRGPTALAVMASKMASTRIKIKWLDTLGKRANCLDESAEQYELCLRLGKFQISPRAGERGMNQQAFIDLEELRSLNNRESAGLSAFPNHGTVFLFAAKCQSRTITIIVKI